MLDKNKAFVVVPHPTCMSVLYMFLRSLLEFGQDKSQSAKYSFLLWLVARLQLTELYFSLTYETKSINLLTVSRLQTEAIRLLSGETEHLNTQ